MELTWKAVEATDSYNVYRSTTEPDSVTGDPLATGISSAQYTDDAAQNGRVYYYRVTALSDMLESEGSDADVGVQGVDSDAADDVWVVGGGGTVFRWNGSEWTPTDLGDPGLVDIEVATNDQSGYTVGVDGAVFHFDGSDWARQETPIGQNLEAVVQGDPAIAVGASGTILER